MSKIQPTEIDAMPSSFEILGTGTHTRPNGKYWYTMSIFGTVSSVTFTTGETEDISKIEFPSGYVLLSTYTSVTVTDGYVILYKQ